MSPTENQSPALTNDTLTNDALTNDVDVLLGWKGRTEQTTDVASRAWAQRVQATLQPSAPAPLAPGDPIPPLWHFALHLASVPLDRLGPDGHPKRGGFLPPVELPRRMWAGSRLTFHEQQIVVGDTVTKTSTIDQVVMKSGRSGQLCFVTVRHELTVDGQPRITEEQDLVYRDHPAPDAPAPSPKPAPASSDADWVRTVVPSPVLLFRYSALTFNSHRIHYDREYARNVEGYDALVVQGPLTATLLADLATSETGRRLATYSFRGVSPLLDTGSFTLAGQPASPGNPGNPDGVTELWAANEDGGLAMSAQATFR